MKEFFLILRMRDFYFSLGLSWAIAKLEFLGPRLGRTIHWWRKYFWLAVCSNKES